MSQVSLDPLRSQLAQARQQTQLMQQQLNKQQSQALPLSNQLKSELTAQRIISQQSQNLSRYPLGQSSYIPSQTLPPSLQQEPLVSRAVSAVGDTVSSLSVNPIKSVGSQGFTYSITG